MSWAWRSASWITTRDRCDRWTRVVVATTSRTRSVTTTDSRSLVTNRMSGLGGRAGVPAELVVQRLEADAERPRGLGLVVARRGQRLQDQRALGGIEGRAHVEHDGAGSGWDRRDRAGQREMHGRDQAAVAHDGRALEAVAELAHIAGPRVRAQHAERRIVHRGDALVVLGAELLEKGLDQERDVVAALAQRRHRQAHDVQAVIEILAEGAGANRLHGLLVGRGEHSHIDLDLGLAAEASDHAVLEDPQELRLKGRAHLGDLVEEDRALVRQLEAARPPLERAGERAPLVAEDLALEQRGGDRGTVDGDEGAPAPRRQLVERARD